MNEDLKAVGAQIRAARKKLNLSQVDFSERLNISPSYISDIEMGKTKFGIDIFMRITETLQVSADWLLRTNIPEVTVIYNQEINAILSDCSPSEIESILKMMRDIKDAIQYLKV